MPLQLLRKAVEHVKTRNQVVERKSFEQFVQLALVKAGATDSDSTPSKYDSACPISLSP